MTGLDEAGRGCLAGPLIVAAVRFYDSGQTFDYSWLNDSKKLTEAKRKVAFSLIYSHAKNISISWRSAEFITKYGLSKALNEAFIDAYLGLKVESVNHDKTIIDGPINYLKAYKNTHAVIKADSIFPEVMAASIVAKVLRDEYMKKQEIIFPEYSFVRHKGYGTKAHHFEIEKNGTLPIHRLNYKTFMKV